MFSRLIEIQGQRIDITKLLAEIIPVFTVLVIISIMLLKGKVYFDKQSLENKLDDFGFELSDLSNYLDTLVTDEFIIPGNEPSDPLLTISSHYYYARGQTDLEEESNWTPDGTALQGTYERSLRSHLSILTTQRQNINEMFLESSIISNTLAPMYLQQISDEIGNIRDLLEVHWNSETFSLLTIDKQYSVVLSTSRIIGNIRRLERQVYGSNLEIDQEMALALQAIKTGVISLISVLGLNHIFKSIRNRKLVSSEG